MDRQNQDIQPEHYESVLKYMQTTNEQDFNAAVAMMKAHGFNLQTAVQTKLGLHEESSRGGSGGTSAGMNNEMEDQEQVRMTRNARVQEDVRRYIQYLRQRKSNSIFLSVFSFAKNVVVGLISGLTEFLLPEFILKKIFRSRFYNLYRNKILPQLRDRPLSTHLKQSPNSRKPILFIISSPTVHQSVLTLLNQPQIAKKIEQSFILSGAIKDQKQCNNIQGNKQTPMIVVCRKNVFEKVQVIKKYVGDREIMEINIQRLNYALREHQRLARRDRNLLIRYRNYLRRTYYGNRPGYLQQQQQQQLFQQQPQKQTTHTSLIQQQNKEYQKIEAESRRKQSLQLLQKQKEHEQRRKMSQIEQQRKARKMSIPDQPTTGQLIRINFRCPDGSTKIRNFQMADQLEMVYAWVETNQEIEFEDQGKRQFQLMYGFPPVSLGDRKEKLLRDVFQSDQEKVMIREI